MSKVYADAVTSPEATQDLTLGGSGDNVIVTAGATLKTNTIKDSGGNILWTSDGSGTLSGVNTAMKGNMVLLSSQTVSNSASVSCTSAITGAFTTYKLYIFKLINIHPDTDNVDFNFNGSIDGGSNYNVTKTTTQFRVYHNEDNSGTPAIADNPGADLANATGDQRFIGGASGGSSDLDSTTEITMHLFNPSSTTYVKHFYMDAQGVKTGPSGSVQTSSTYFTAGYFNTASAINALIFRCGSGNFDGTIKLYGISKS